MKKKILSLILVLMLIPIASLFSACGKEKGYDLTTLDDEFFQIAEYENLKLQSGKVVFDYSSHGNFAEIINKTAPYKNLNNYNYVFENLMCFAVEYIDECSNNSSTDNVQIKNQVKTDLDNFKQAIKDVDVCLNSFAQEIKTFESNVKTPVCLGRFENLLKTYEIMFHSAINFNNSLTNLYFNYILKDGNPNVYAIDVTNFDANIVVSKFNSRIQYQKSLLTQSYIEMYIGGDLAENIADEKENLLLTVFGYYEKVENLKKTFSQESAVFKANNEANKQSFYNLAVKAQNIQTTLNNDREKFINACNTIEYSQVKIASTQTPHEQMCVKIIDSNYELISVYNDILIQMLNIIA